MSFVWFDKLLHSERSGVATYLTNLDGKGVDVDKLSAMQFTGVDAGVTSQLDDPVVTTVWEGIRRTRGAPPG